MSKNKREYRENRAKNQKSLDRWFSYHARRRNFKLVRAQQMSPEITKVVSICPGGRHAWCDSPVGRIRKQIGAIPVSVR